MQDKRFRNKIIKALRKLTWSWKPYTNVKQKAKRDAATYECNVCGKYCYTGKSDKTFDRIVEENPDTVVEKGAIYIDHTIPVIDPKIGFENFDTFIKRLFCEEENLNPMCKKCHDQKTDEENKFRRRRK